jgi:hypothetical protein
MQRVIGVLVAFNVFVTIGVLIFVIHGSARSGCAEAATAAANAWQAVALVPNDAAAAELAAMVAAGDVAGAGQLDEADLWNPDATRRVAGRNQLRGQAGVLELARAATLRARAVCE